eukprot:COSAG02_NODE_17054_length_1032_cov_1.263666_2_plen_122_part_01
MIGDSAILVVGASGRGMIDNSKNWNYPAYNLIEVSVIPQLSCFESRSHLFALHARIVPWIWLSDPLSRLSLQGNHVATVGVWVKQTAAYFKSVTRENTIRNNVFHDSPRSLVNWNDVIFFSE